MKIKILFLPILFFISIVSKAESIHLINDTLYCNLSYNEVGTLKSQASSIPDLNFIKTIVLGGYISQADEDFIHTLGKNYNLQNINMTELRSSISSHGLEGCIKIKSVKYSKHWKSTGEYLFEDCTNLTEVIFPDDSVSNLTSFSSGTFRGCSSLKSISIPKGIKSLDSQVFYSCHNLKEINCNSGIAPSATEEAFGGQFSTATIYVPKGAMLNYQTSAGWCLFKNYKENPDILYENDLNMVSENVHIINDTLFCNLSMNETGYLRTSVLAKTHNINSIKHVVLDGYLDSNDGSFLNALSSSYSLSSLDMTNLRSTFASYQFQGCDKLTKVKYSRYWSSTGWYLFKECANITKVIFPENIIGNGYTSFETGTFKGCTSLEEITIPSTVSSIGDQCFYLCSRLKTITLKPITPPVAKESSFGGQFYTAKLIVPKGTKSDYESSSGWSLFTNIEENTEDVYIEEKEISENVSFSDGILYAHLPIGEIGRLKATVLTKYPDLSQIHGAVISNYVNNEDVSFLNSLASSYNLSSIDFTELRSILENYAFQGCSKLSEVKYSRYWKATGWYLFEDCSSLIDVQFPTNPVGTGITLFESGSYRGCSALQHIIIPESVTTIESQCFYLCHSLKNVTFLGSSIERIDKEAFEGCYSLETIILPNSLKIIDERCFEGCPQIKEIHCESLTPPDVSETAFDEIYEKATLYVPVGCREKYESAPVWKKFHNITECQTSDIYMPGTDIETKLSIYSINGKLLYKGDGVGNFTLPSGFYIIRKNGSCEKIIVK